MLHKTQTRPVYPGGEAGALPLPEGLPPIPHPGKRPCNKVLETLCVFILEAGSVLEMPLRQKFGFLFLPPNPSQIQEGWHATRKHTLISEISNLLSTAELGPGPWISPRLQAVPHCSLTGRKWEKPSECFLKGLWVQGDSEFSQVFLANG